MLESAQAAGQIAEAASSAGSAGVLGTLGLNWKLFLAQLVNFSIVVFVLWKWAFTPLMKTLERRSTLIEESVQKAKEIDERLRRVDLEGGARLTEAKEEARTIIEKAHQAALVYREQESAQTKEDVKRLLESEKKELAVMRAAVVDEARADLANIVAEAVAKIIPESHKNADETLVIKAARALADKQQKK